MPSNRQDEARDYGFANQALALRERAGLTQDSLAASLGVSKRAVQTWEGGDSYPGDEHLKGLIALYLARGIFAAGREEADAVALWEAAREKATRRMAPFDPHWFASLRRKEHTAVPTIPAPPAPDAALPPRRLDWGEAPSIDAFHGRAGELATLSRWLLVDRCRLVAVLGMGGIGKTLLAARLAYTVAPAFSVVYWRSLRNAPPVEEWLAGAIAAFAPEYALPGEGYVARLTLLLQLLQARRGLLVLDNLETILAPGASTARYQEGYAGYGEVLRRVGESLHQSCLLVTGREAPPELALLLGEEAPVRRLQLEGLVTADGRALLQEQALTGDDAAWEALIAHYSGNPLALRVVGETIGVVFGGDIAAFLAQEASVFGGIRQLLDMQVERVSPLERSIMNWLAVEREPVGFADLVADLGPTVARSEVVEAVEALGRRSLLERGSRGAFTLQPVVLEYTTARLIDACAQEILAGKPVLLVSQALIKAQAKDYVRRSQERLIAQPLLEQVRAYTDTDAVARLLMLLDLWRNQVAAEQGYGPGNVVNLLRLLRGDLRGLDLSRLALRQVYLQAVDVQDTSLANAHVSGVVFAEVFNFPTSVAFDAHGMKLAVGTSTGEVYLWRVADRTLLLALQGHTSAPPAMALSEDGRLLVTSSFDGAVLLWEAESGRLVATLPGHAGLIWCLALSGDGRLVASGSMDGTVKLWEVARSATNTPQDRNSLPASGPPGRLLATLTGHAGGVLAVALSGDGRLVASGSHEGTIRLWETAHGRLVATLQGHTGGVQSVALSGDGRVLVSGSHDGTIKLWATQGVHEGGQLLATLKGHASAVRCVALSGDGELVASCSVDGTIKLWTAPEGLLLATLQGHTSGIRGVALSKDGQVVASASFDGTVKLWEATPVLMASAQASHALQASESPGRLLATLQGHIATVPGVALSRDGLLAVSGSQDGAIRLWATRPAVTEGRVSLPAGRSAGLLLATLQGHTGTVWSVALSGDGLLLASGSYDGTVKLWDTKGVLGSGRLLATLQEQATPINVNGVALSGDGRLVAGGSEDGTLTLWETASGRHLATLRGHTGAVWSVALSWDGRLLASGSWDGTVKLWRTTPVVQASGSPEQLLETLQGHSSGVWGVALSRDGQLLASGSYDGTVKLWATESGRLLSTLRGHTGSVRGVALSEDGRLVASASYDGTVKLWEVESGQLVATLQGHSSGVLDVALSGDGLLVASGGWDGAVKLWESRTGVCLQTLQSDCCYERMDIRGLTGVTEAQRAVLRALGAVDQAPAPQAEPTPSGAAAPTTQIRTPTNLPTARTTFVGRTQELAALSQVLDPAMRTGTRLLTLIGVAGCGKSRLALALAARVCDTFEDGVWLVELAPLAAGADANPTPLAAATLRALGLPEQPGQGLLETLVTFFRTGHVLLLLDNCEHVVAACSVLVAQLLRDCPELYILATSQQALGIAAEAVRPVLPLSLPPVADTAPAEAPLTQAEQSDAVQLFVQQARAVQPDFDLSDATASSVAAICHRLDGLPLAIELAAARVAVMPLEEILAQLDDRFHQLGRDRRVTTDRPQIVRMTLDWSYDLLDPVAQAVLRRLAVFAGGWDIAAAEVVCAGGIVAAADVLDVLDELLARSLVYVQQAKGLPRYGQLEPVRRYGLQQLERAGEAVAVRERHATWSALLAGRAASTPLGSE